MGRGGHQGPGAEEEGLSATGGDLAGFVLRKKGAAPRAGGLRRPWNGGAFVPLEIK